MVAGEWGELEWEGFGESHSGTDDIEGKFKFLHVSLGDALRRVPGNKMPFKKHMIYSVDCKDVHFLGL